MNKWVLVTGATSGLGKKVAMNVAAAGYPVLVGGRQPDEMDRVCQGITHATGVEARPFSADLGSLAAVRSAVDAMGALPLHGIVANAGVNSLKEQRSCDGFELTFAVNVLAHHLLLELLSPQIATGGRVVIVSSGVHEPDNKLARRAGIPAPRWVSARALALPDESSPDARLNHGRQRYSTSKLANVLQARGLQAAFRAENRDVDVFAIDPGLMVDTNLARELPAPLLKVFRIVGGMLTPCIDNMRSSDVSARHVTSLMVDPTWHSRGFAYLDGDRIKAPSLDAMRDDLRDDLWQTAQALTQPATSSVSPTSQGCASGTPSSG